MKIKSGFVLHSMGNEHVVVAVEERTKEFCGMIRLNATGAFLWKKLQNECTEAWLIESLMEHYGITEDLAQKAVTAFVAQLKGANVIAP